MSSRGKKQQQNTTERPDSDDGQPVGKRLRRHRTSAVSAKSEPTPSTSTSSAAKSRTPAKKSQAPASKFTDDKCLHAVFERMDIETLCQMPNVCQQFRTTAEQVFEQKYKQFKLGRRTWKISVVRRILCKFGHLMQSFDASEALFDDPNRFAIGALAKYCSNHFDELQLQNVVIDCDAATPLFPRLKKLALTMCDFTGETEPAQLFSSLSKLEHLNFEPKESCRFLVQHYPKLEQLIFDVSYPGYFAFFGLLELNPQLRQLTVFGLPEDIHISAVVESQAKSLERLMITPGIMTSTPEIQTKAGLLQLSKLKKLKKLKLNAGDEEYAKLLGPLMDAFAKAKIQLDQLEANEFLIQSKDIKSILKIESMEILVLNTIEQVNEADIVAMVTQLPKLTTLHLYFGSKVRNPITINGLKKIVNDRKQLVYISFTDVQNLKIDQKAFQNLLKAAQNRRDGGNGGSERRLFIDIYGNKKTTSFNVPDAMQTSGKELLEIRYSDED